MNNMRLNLFRLMSKTSQINSLLKISSIMIIRTKRIAMKKEKSRITRKD